MAMSLFGKVENWISRRNFLKGVGAFHVQATLVNHTQVYPSFAFPQSLFSFLREPFQILFHYVVVGRGRPNKKS